MSRVIGVLSGKGGVGKTTVVANLGAALTQDFGQNILILDSNITTSHLGLHLGLYEDLSVTLKDVLIKKVPVTYAIYVHPTTGVRIIPAPLSGDSIKLSKLDRVINQLRNNYEMIILDCAPGLGKEVITAASSVDEALIVTTADLPAVTDALKTIGILQRIDKEILGIVVNRVKNEKYELTMNEIESTCNCDIISVIPEDNKIPGSISKGVPIVLAYPNSPASIELKKLAGYIIGEEYRPTNFFYAIKKFLGLVKEKPVRMRPVRKISEEKKIYPEKKLEKKPKFVEEVEEEVLSAEEMKEELRKSIRTDIKKEFMEKLKEKLKEKGINES